MLLQSSLLSVGAAKSVKVAAPVVKFCITNGVAAMDEPSIADIESTMGNSAYIIAHCTLEKDHVAWAGVLRVNGGAHAVQTCCTQPSGIADARRGEYI